MQIKGLSRVPYFSLMRLIWQLLFTYLKKSFCCLCTQLAYRPTKHFFTHRFIRIIWKLETSNANLHYAGIMRKNVTSGGAHLHSLTLRRHRVVFQETSQRLRTFGTLLDLAGPVIELRLSTDSDVATNIKRINSMKKHLLTVKHLAYGVIPLHVM